jgi:hypothetical protein
MDSTRPYGTWSIQMYWSGCTNESRRIGKRLVFRNQAGLRMSTLNNGCLDKEPAAVSDSFEVRPPTTLKDRLHDNPFVYGFSSPRPTGLGS